MKIAIQGELGSFSHEAAATFLSGDTVVPCSTSYEVFNALTQGNVGAALVPIENSLAGPVAQHLDLLLEHASRNAGFGRSSAVAIPQSSTCQRKLPARNNFSCTAYLVI